MGFKIDCTDKAQMATAIAQTKALGCANDCTATGCEKNYLIVQSHHDFCREDQIDQDIEKEFHDYDQSCGSIACDIKKFIEGAPTCPDPNCTDKSGDEAYGRMLAAGCKDACNTEDCKNDFLSLVSVHDSCPHDTLSEASAKGLHDMEDACQELYKCNVKDADTYSHTCDEDDHGDHDDHNMKKHSCACEAQEFKFKIDCTDAAQMATALNTIKTKGCAADCTVAECEKNYLIVQSHHDFCREDQISEDLEKSFHDYDQSCKKWVCDIKKYVEGAETCPDPNCTDKSGDEAYGRMLAAGCKDACDTADCKKDYLTLVSVHDSCPHDTLSETAEKGLHDMEDACQKLYKCNVKDADKYSSTCEEDDHNHDAKTGTPTSKPTMQSDPQNVDKASTAAAPVAGIATFASAMLMLL